jgi:hypothetical protein
MKDGKLDIYGRKNMIALLSQYLYLPENDVPLVQEHFLFDAYPRTFSDASTIAKIAS